VYQLTRHLEVAFDEGSSTIDVGRGARYLLKNALMGTRLLCRDDAWEVFQTYQTPRELGESPLESRAVQANVISPVDFKPQETELSRRFETVARKILKYRKVEPAENLVDLALQIKDVCGPSREYEEATHYLWADPKKLFHIMMDHMVAYLKLELNSFQVAPISIPFAQQSLGRPERNGEFAQQLCTLHTSQARAHDIQERFPAPARFLTLGDDDLMSLALTEAPGYEMDCFEIDRSLVRFIKKRKSEAVSVYSRDLTKGLPEEFHGLYDAVLADPPYNADGMAWFIKCCSQGLKKSEASRLYLSTYPDLLESSDQFFEEFGKNGLELKKTTPCYNRYPFPKETHDITSVGLRNLGYHPELVGTIMSVPYLYAHLFECEWA
jgi:hypothetical protein